jgi:nucleoside-diphosphate kinase
MSGVHAVVLAAGRGRRMGGAKHLLEVPDAHGRRASLLAHVIRSLRPLELSGITVVLAPGDRSGERVANAEGARAVPAESADEGRAASVRAGVRSAPDALGWLFALADQPYLQAQDFVALLTAAHGDPGRIVHARYAGERGTPVLFGARFRDELLGLHGKDGGRAVLRAHPDALFAVDLDVARGRDLDTPGDLARMPDVDLRGDPSTMPRRMERTLSIIKPDAVAAHKIGAILAAIEAKGLRIAALRMLRLTPEQAESFYAVHRERPFYKSLCEFMCSGPIVVSALEADDAIPRYRALMGATNPAQAAEGTLRKLFATDVERNAVHGSDAPETAKQEIRFFFPEL